MSAPTDPIDTIGLRLQEQARAIATRHLPDLGWTSPLGVLLDHVTEPAARFEGRFDRVEGGGAAVAVPPMSGGRPSASAGRPMASAGRLLESDVSERLRAVVGPGAEAMRVHDDDAADATAVAHRADAVTVGSDVYFRRGRLRPRDPAGFGLLVHEATHVLERLRPGVSWRRSTAAGMRDEESAALTRESAARPSRVSAHRPSAPPPVASAGIALPAPQPATPHPAPAARPMAAATDRDVPAPPPAAPIDLDALRRSLVPELMRRLRDEFERGA